MHKLKERDVQLQASIYAELARSAGSLEEKSDLYSHVLRSFDDCDAKYLVLKYQYHIEVCKIFTVNFYSIINDDF